MFKEHVNGFENIGASLNNFKNFHRDVKCFIHERHGQLFIDHFKEMAETRQGFYFDYDIDDDGSLCRVIWANSTARRNYSVFGDTVSFDQTYSTNKKEPKYIITYQYSGIIKSVPLVFKSARYRFYMWHIMNKVPSKSGLTRSDYPAFISWMNDIIWDEDLEEDEFNAQWAGSL
ncbi:protein FAR-RED IMPAIRED RESPONSE 1-like [Silene latifolia]|uniref:protein FAR-RED IMPAIRED RESPONSE 1-like n=1 Tax=Silene latifolia TaxID=37657 RepID=UPI003D774B6F